MRVFDIFQDPYAEDVKTGYYNDDGDSKDWRIMVVLAVASIFATSAVAINGVGGSWSYLRSGYEWVAKRH